MHILLLAWLLLENYKNKTWKQFPKYYPNIFYVALFNCLYYFLVHHKFLWELQSTIINRKALKIIHICIINPLLILLYLSNLPNTFIKQFFYVVRWIITSTMVEVLFKNKKKIAFYRGWNLGWSMAIYIKMYIFCLLLNKKPILTLILSIIDTICFLLKFKIPVRKNMKKQIRNWI
jgi:hypothetical protein